MATDNDADTTLPTDVETETDTTLATETATTLATETDTTLATDVETESDTTLPTETDTALPTDVEIDTDITRPAETEPDTTSPVDIPAGQEIGVGPGTDARAGWTAAAGMGHDPDMEDDPADAGGPGSAPPSPGTSPNQAVPGPRRLERSQDRKIAGVAGGIAEYFSIDPIIVRLAFVVAVFAGGIGFIAYLLAWLILPESASPPTTGQPRQGVDRSTAVAIALLVLAAIIGIADTFDGGLITAAILVGAGVYLLQQRPLDTPPASEVIPAPAGAAAPPASGATDRFPPPPPPPGPATTPPTPREPALLTRATLSLLALFFAGAIIVDQLGWVDVDVSRTLAVALVGVGIASIVAAFVGRARGLTIIGIVLVLAFAASAVVEPVIDDGVGERRYEIAGLDEIETEYRLGIGELVVDLSTLEIPDGTTVAIDVELGFGEARVIVPDDVDLRIDGDVGVGEVRVLGDVENGIRNEVSVAVDEPGDAELVVDLTVGFGQGRVER